MCLKIFKKVYFYNKVLWKWNIIIVVLFIAHHKKNWARPRKNGVEMNENKKRNNRKKNILGTNRNNQRWEDSCHSVEKSRIHFSVTSAGFNKSTLSLQKS